MKRILLSIIALVLCFCLFSCSSKPALTSDQIASYRDQFPVVNTDEAGVLAEYFPIDMERLSNQFVIDWVRVICLDEAEPIYTSGKTGQEADDSTITAIEEKTGTSFAIDHEVHRFHMKVKDSYYSTMQRDDTFTLLVYDVDMTIMPSLENGKEYIIGLIRPNHPDLAEVSEYFGTIFDFMFYVTDNGYVLSVSGYENKDPYSGITVDEWVKKVQALKK